MDTETFRLLITAGGLILSTALGAVISGYVTHKNQKANHRELQHHWKRDRQKDHELWLRERKMEAYSNYKTQMTGFVHEWNTAGTERKADIALVRSFLARYSHVDISLVGPPQVVRLASESSECLFAFMRCIVKGEDAEALSFMDKHSKLDASLQNEMRSDLNIPEDNPTNRLLDTHGESVRVLHF